MQVKWMGIMWTIADAYPANISGIKKEYLKDNSMNKNIMELYKGLNVYKGSN
jgi:hypothetical protein